MVIMQWVIQLPSSGIVYYLALGGKVPPIEEGRIGDEPGISENNFTADLNQYIEHLCTICEVIVVHKADDIPRSKSSRKGRENRAAQILQQ